MKNLINKVRHHGKKITIHLKRHHRKYLFGALCGGILLLVGMMFFSGSKADSILDFLESAQQQGLYGYSNTDFLNITDVTDSYINIESPIIRSGTIDINGYLFVASTTTAQKNPVAYRCFNDVTKDGDNFSVGLSTEGLDDSQVYYIYATPIDSTTGEYNGKCNTNEANEFLQSAASAGSDTTVNGIDPCVVIQDNFYGEGLQCENEKLITYNPDANITYTLNKGFDTEQTFSAGTITISNGEDSITILDRNLGATTNDVNDTGSYGYHFQWGNNYGFDPFDESVTENATTGKATWSQSYINKGYFGNIFIKSTDNTNDYWIDSVENNGNHYNLWGGVYEDNINNTDNYVLTNLSGDNWIVTNPKDRQGPCPDGYHIPNYGELLKIKSMLRGVTSSFHENLLIPFAGGRSYNASLAGVGNFAKLWSSSPFSSTDTDSFTLQIYVDYPIKVGFSGRVGGGSIRCFKNSVDDIPPTCDIEYSTTGLTNQNVTAALTCDEDVTVTNNSGSAYTFENTGTFLFEFQDLAGNTGEKLAEVTGIDKIVPTCNVAYDTTGATTGNVVVSLTGCSETITGTDLQHTFTGNGTYTFEFQDLAGNTGSTGAEVTWIISGNSTVYFDIEGNEFNWDELTVCNPYDSRSCITMMDRNLGATTNDISKTGSYGFYYQWGNNYGFLPNLESLRTGEYQVDASSYGPGNYYNSGVYNVLPRNTVYARDRSTVRNNNLWGGSGDDLDNNYLGYPVRNPTDRQGPCPDGYHVPSMGERLKVVEWWALYTNGAGYGDFLINTFSKPGLSGGILKFRSDFYIPGSKSFYTNRYDYEDFYDVQESLNFLRSSSPIPYTSGDYTEFGFVPHNIDNRSSRILYLDSLRSYGAGEGRNLAAPLRCFKNNTGYNQVDNGIRFSISIDNNIKTGEFTTFTVKVLKNGAFYSDYTGTILFTLTNNNGGLVNKKSYTIYNSGHYTFEAADGGRKVFYSGLKITEAGTYILEIKGLENGGIGSGLISVGKKHNSFDFKYNTLSFNPNYSDEMNEAYQYARYYTITTKDNIKEADMYGGLNRIAMAKMLVNYAENVLGINNYNTGRNCKFADVSAGLDKEYYYGVTKACQLGIMGVNMPNNKFYPNGGVTRAEFATALSRLLYGTPDGVGKYYSTHLVKLYQEKIITNTDPTLRELRGYVMLMLMRSDKK